MDNCHNHYQRKSPFEISELAEFDRDIEADDEETKRRKRIAYLKQAMSQVESGKKMMGSFGCLLVPFMIIPLFWPFLYFMKKSQRNAMNLLDDQVEGALDYWGVSRREID